MAMAMAMAGQRRRSPSRGTATLACRGGVQVNFPEHTSSPPARPGLPSRLPRCKTEVWQLWQLG